MTKKQLDKHLKKLDLLNNFFTQRLNNPLITEEEFKGIEWTIPAIKDLKKSFIQKFESSNHS